jgi:hypothetical protein
MLHLKVNRTESLSLFGAGWKANHSLIQAMKGENKEKSWAI